MHKTLFAGLLLATVCLGGAQSIVPSAPKPLETSAWKRRSIPDCGLSLSLPGSLHLESSEHPTDAGPYVRSITSYSYLSEGISVAVVVSEGEEKVKLTADTLKLFGDGVLEGLKSDDAKLTLLKREAGFLDRQIIEKMELAMKVNEASVSTRILLLADGKKTFMVLIAHPADDKFAAKDALQVLGSVRYAK